MKDSKMNTDHENFENHDSLLLENLSRQHPVRAPVSGILMTIMT